MLASQAPRRARPIGPSTTAEAPVPESEPLTRKAPREPSRSTLCTQAPVLFELVPGLLAAHKMQLDSAQQSYLPLAIE